MVSRKRVALAGSGLMMLLLGCVVGGLWADGGGDDWTAPAAAAAKKNPMAADAKSIAAGQALFTRNCAMCHGDKGKGDGPAAAMFTPAPHDLSDKKVQAQSDGAFFWKITEGKKPMPGFQDGLTETERWQVVNFVRSLAAAPATSSQPAKK